MIHSFLKLDLQPIRLQRAKICNFACTRSVNRLLMLAFSWMCFSLHAMGLILCNFYAYYNIVYHLYFLTFRFRIVRLQYVHDLEILNFSHNRACLLLRTYFSLIKKVLQKIILLPWRLLWSVIIKKKIIYEHRWHIGLKKFLKGNIYLCPDSEMLCNH